MAYDAGMLAAVIDELNRGSAGARVDKVYQPQNDTVILGLRTRDGARRLLMRCGANDPRMAYTNEPADNPAVPPTLCMLMRKHFVGSVFVGATQPGFERVARLEFDGRDEMGYDCKKFIYAEVMGKNSNLIFTDGNGKILGAMRQVDFTTSRLRQVLPGMLYELPPAQDKRDPLTETRDGFLGMLEECIPDRQAAKQINSAYLGISPTVAREIAFRASGSADATVGGSSAYLLWREFAAVIELIKEKRFTPVMACHDGAPAEYSFLPLLQYGESELRTYGSFGELLDTFYGERDRRALVRSRADDLLRTMKAAENRLCRKLDAQRSELADCEHGDDYRRDADLITANLYLIKRGDTDVRLTDYSEMNEDGSFAVRTVKLDGRLSPSANAQRLYKKYAKSKTAKRELTKQLALGETELEYVRSALDALSRAETGAELAEIREELWRSGYAGKQKTPPPKKIKSAPSEFVTSGGYTVLCGKNNLQNDELTFHRADRSDIWFHAKGVPGSHVVLVCGGEAPDADMTEAAEIAAYFSGASGGDNVAVDYTAVRNIKKPAGARPGYVIYHTNQTAYVTPDPDKIKSRKRH